MSSLKDKYNSKKILGILFDLVTSILVEDSMYVDIQMQNTELDTEFILSGYEEYIDGIITLINRCNKDEEKIRLNDY